MQVQELKQPQSKMDERDSSISQSSKKRQKQNQRMQELAGKLADAVRTKEELEQENLQLKINLSLKDQELKEVTVKFNQSSQFLLRQEIKQLKDTMTALKKENEQLNRNRSGQMMSMPTFRNFRNSHNYQHASRTQKQEIEVEAS
jgi:hypothetical protein